MCTEIVTGLESILSCNTTLGDLLWTCGNRALAERAGTCATSTVSSSQQVFKVPSDAMQLSLIKRCSVELILL